MQIQLLGGFAISIGDALLPQEKWSSRRVRSLLKLLALSPGHRLHRDVVIDRLWPEFGFYRSSQQLLPDSVRCPPAARSVCARLPGTGG